ncbi:MAG: CHASE domain-containing protein [Candidatus Kapaibacterium sp.]
MPQKHSGQMDSYESILKETSRRKESVFKLSRTYPAYIVLVVAILLSIGVWYVADQAVTSDMRNTFNKSVNSVMNRLETKYQSDHQVLNSMHGLYESQYFHQVVRDVFELYGAIPTRTYPSILSIAYAEKVTAAHLDDYIYYTMSEGLYDYEIHPKGKRDLFCPIKYIVPLDENLHRSGWDLTTEPHLWQAIQKARDENEMTATHFFEIRPDTVGFFMIYPIYKKDSSHATQYERRQNFEGALLLESHGRLFFAKALGDSIASDRNIIFKCFDSTSATNPAIVFESKNSSLLEDDYQPAMTGEQELMIANVPLKVKFYAVPDFGGAFQQYLPMLALIISLVLSFAFFGFLLSVITSRARAVDLAERMTRSQRRIVESSKDIISVLDFDGKWLSMNPASHEIFGYEPTEMTGRRVDELFDRESDMKEFYGNINKEAREEYTRRFDIRMKTAGGAAKWISWSLTVSPEDKHIYAIGRDVTVEKMAEAEARLRSNQIRLAEQYAREANDFKSFFMTKLSHQLRNSLTGIIGYLQLLSGKVYETEEEQESYLQLAEESSEELFTFVSDIVDATTQADESAKTNPETLRVGSAFNSAMQEIRTLERAPEINIDFHDNSTSTRLVADPMVLANSLRDILLALSDDIDSPEFKISAEENRYENTSEIQIVGPGAKIVEELIEVYKYNQNSLIDALETDTNDILLRLATAASNIRRMNGQMTLETFGHGEGNIVMISLPLQKMQI